MLNFFVKYLAFVDIELLFIESVKADNRTFSWLFCGTSSVFLCALFNMRKNCQCIWLCVLLFSHMWFIISTSKSLTFWLCFCCKALISPYVEHITLDSVKVKWWEDRINFCLTTVFSPARCQWSSPWSLRIRTRGSGFKEIWKIYWKRVGLD